MMVVYGNMVGAGLSPAPTILPYTTIIWQ